MLGLHSDWMMGMMREQGWGMAGPRASPVRAPASFAVTQVGDAMEMRIIWRPPADLDGHHDLPTIPDGLDRNGLV